VLEPDGLYYTRFTCLNALGRAVQRFQQEEPEGPPILFITHLTEYYGRHVGRGEWAGMLTTYGAFRHEFVKDLGWFLFLSLLANLILLGVLCTLILR
jgi:hypothetical protein